MNRKAKPSRRWVWLWAIPALALCCGLPIYLVVNLLRGGSRAIRRVVNADAKLQSAAETAQKTLPMFIKRLKHPEPGDRFAVKGRFRTDIGSEYLWLKDPKIDKEGFTATLDQQPIAIVAHKGDRLHVDFKNAFDWLIKRADGLQTGGFTEIALQPPPQ